MKTESRGFLARLDNAVRWTGIPALVAEDLSGKPSDRRYRPRRWSPIGLIIFAGALFIASMIVPLNLVALAPSLGAAFVALAPAIQKLGPLGKESFNDDEREAALRKNALLFCLGFLACMNCVGQPLLVVLSHLQHWDLTRVVSVAASGFLLNLTLFGCLPTLYASWQLPTLATE